MISPHELRYTKKIMVCLRIIVQMGYIMRVIKYEVPMFLLIEFTAYKL